MRLTSIADLQRSDTQDLEQRAYGLSRLFEDFYENYPDDSHTREAGIHASELNACKRQVVYSLFNTEKKGTIEAVWRKRFLVGTAIHTMLQRDLHLMADSGRYGVTFEEEVKVNETALARELYLTSSCDGIFTFWSQSATPTPVIRMGLEAKSMAPNEFEGLKKPKEEHVEQAHVYMACLDLPFTWFLYWNKGNQNITPSVRPYVVKFDPQIWANLRTRAESCLANAREGTLPDREEGVNCRWCKYSWTCNPASLKKAPGRRPLLPIVRR